ETFLVCETHRDRKVVFYGFQSDWGTSWPPSSHSFAVRPDSSDSNPATIHLQHPPQAKPETSACRKRLSKAPRKPQKPARSSVLKRSKSTTPSRARTVYRSSRQPISASCPEKSSLCWARRAPANRPCCA